MAAPTPTPSLPVGAATSCASPALPALAPIPAEVPDTRQGQGRRHPLAAVLCLMLAALLSGRDTGAAIAAWGREYPVAVMLALGFPRGKTPCPSTLHLILKELNWTALESQLRAWAEAVLEALGLGVEVAPAADGKTLRGSLKQGSEVTHLLSVVVHGLSLTLSHEPVARKSNEIPALPTLLSRLVLAGRVITVDALLTQREIARQLVEADADYVMPVKGNQPALQAAIAAQLNSETPAGVEPQSCQTHEAAHGRFEWRRLTMVQVPEETSDWPGAAQVFRLERVTWRCPRKGTPRYQCSTVYGISSLPRARAGAGQLLALTRGHWGDREPVPLGAGLFVRRGCQPGGHGGRGAGHGPAAHRGE